MESPISFIVLSNPENFIFQVNTNTIKHKKFTRFSWKQFPWKYFALTDILSSINYSKIFNDGIHISIMPNRNLA